VGIDPVSGERVERFALLREPHCRGFESGREQTAAQWVADQGLEPYNEMNDRLLGLIQWKRRRGKAPLTPGERARFHLALYDLDAFRRRLALDDLPDAGLSKTAITAAVAGDEVDLLRLAYQWTQGVLPQHPPRP
jgi:hypothetical protein